MATNKHAIIRYQTLDKCFRNPGRKYYVEDLIEACNKSICEFTGNNLGISRRQIFEDIKFMESSQGWNIDLQRQKHGHKVFYRYTDINFSINNSLLNEAEENQLKEVLSTLSRFVGMPQFEWVEEMTVRLKSSFSSKIEAAKIIEFEQNKFLKGLNFFSDFFNAIVYKKTLCIEYKGFKQVTPVKIIFHPYYLKQFNSRWFVFGKADERRDITNIPIDRVLNITASKVSYVESVIDFNEYFEDAVGVSIPENGEPEIIRIKISKELWPYIETKPIHGSQKIKEKTVEFTIIELLVFVNYELLSLLFSLGDGVIVLEPASVASLLKKKAELIFKNYS